MKTDEIKKIARQHGIRTGKMKKGDIVRAIQTAEGNNDCFDTGQAENCGQNDCLWRDDCK
jgi:hypothetical protein